MGEVGTDERRADVAVVGAGPAGLGAAVEAAEHGLRVVVLDEAPRAGGPLWRGKMPLRASAWLERARRAGVEIVSGASVFDARPGEVLVEANGALRVRCETIVAATGSTERFLPFPGWTLPGVLGVGGLQAMIKGGLDVAGKRVVIAGTGPLMFATATLAREAGAEVLEIVEQAPRSRVLSFGARMLLAKPKQTASYLRALRGIRRSTSSWVIGAHGKETLNRVVVHGPRGDRSLDCDLAACGYGLIPRIELAALLGCEVSGGAVGVNSLQRTNVGGVLAAGETTGVAGVDAALLGGRIAGLVAAGADEEARQLVPAHERARRVGALIESAFFLRPELMELARPDTIICRCEDVALRDVESFDEVRDAKLQTRCGMGPCQARVCGPALETLRDFGRDRTRPPLAPVSLETLASTGRNGSNS